MRDRMAAMQLVGHCGPDRLRYRTGDPVPRPGDGELLVKVAGAAKNNIDRKIWRVST